MSQWSEAIDPAAFLHGAFDHNIATVPASDARPPRKPRHTMLNNLVGEPVERDTDDYVGRHRSSDA
jgi:hypothetical protein